MSDSYQAVEPSIIEKLRSIWKGMTSALALMPRWEKGFHVLWLLGPFVLLIERTPADIWLSILAVAFVARSILKSEWSWLRVFWVQACFLFLFTCMFSSATSIMPKYAFSETVAWFRFPLFAMATAFWLGVDKRLLYAMLVSTGLGLVLMSGILTLEMIVEGQKDGRLSWPYDDLVPGNYLAKVGLPAFTVMMALAVGARPRLAFVMGGLSFVSIIMSVLAGERVNFLLRACSGMLAALVWKPNVRRYMILIVVELLAIIAVLLSSVSIQDRYIDRFIKSLPTSPKSEYFRAMAAGPEAAKDTIITGLGPATFRDLCPKIIGQKVGFDCHNHPHNFYVQLLTETGIIGLISGCLMIGSITWAAFYGWRHNRANVVAATAFVVPFGLFFPIQTTGDFFGQWNNIFMWSAISLALASARNLASNKSRQP